MLFGTIKIKSFVVLIGSALFLVSGISQSVAEEKEHSMQHGSMHHGSKQNHESSHAGHKMKPKGEHGGHGGKQDHTARRAAIAAKYSNGHYARSESNYDLKSIDLVRMDEQSVKLADELASDSPVLLNFIFTSCSTVCPVLSSTFSQFQAQLGDEAKKVKLISISIDPQYDTPEKLREYAKLFQAGPQWKFYTGSDKQSVQAQKAFKAYRGSKMNHIPLTFLKAGAGSKWVRLEGFTSSSQLVREYRNLMNL